MEKFTTLTGTMVAIPTENIDTDQIIPARFLKVTDKQGLGDNLFCDWRYNEDGTPKTDFVLNTEQGEKAKILVAGESEDESGDKYFTIVRYTTAGVLDITFNGTGAITTPIGSGLGDAAFDVAIQSDGKIVAVGLDGEEDGNQQNVAVVRYLNHWHTTVFVPVILKE